MSITLCSVSAQSIRPIVTFVGLYSALHFGGMMPHMYTMHQNHNEEQRPYFLFTVQIVCAIICAWQIDRLSRRRLVMFSSLCNMFSSVAMGVLFYMDIKYPKYHQGLTKTSNIILLMYTSSTTVGLVMSYVLIPELFDNRVRDLCCSIVTIFICIISYASMSMVFIIDAYFGYHYALWLRSGFCALGVLLAFVLPETACLDVHDSTPWTPSGSLLTLHERNDQQPATASPSSSSSLLSLPMSLSTQNANVVTTDSAAADV